MTLDTNAQFNMFLEIMVDLFAGGGGASTGGEKATGRIIDLAVNHDPWAVLLHKTNHPYTEHLCENVFDVDPVKACRGRPVGMLWASPDCFIAGTLVLTKSGYKPIEQIRVGDMVLTHKNRWRAVTETMKSQKETMLVRGYGHSGLICSRKHPFYVRDKKGEPSFVAAKEIKKGQYWGVPTELPETDIPLFNGLLPDSDLMWLAGRYVGDGWLRMDGHHNETVITCGAQDIDFLRGMFAGMAENKLKWNFREVRTGGQFTCCRRDLTEWLYENFGKGSENKFITTWLMGAPKELITPFLTGYLSADGHVAKNKGNDLIEVTTVSKRLAYGLVHLAASTGKSAMVYKTDDQNGVIEGRTVNTRPAYIVKWRTEVADKHRQTFESNGILWRPIRETVELKNTMTVYNLSVEEDESYIAEGVIVHNCTHHSKARGGKPVKKHIRGLPWIIVRWALAVRPRCIFFENVEEIQGWGPLLMDAKGDEYPDPKRKGETFKDFVGILTGGVPEDHPALAECLEFLHIAPGSEEARKLAAGLGYDFEGRELVAADYGTPTIRKRYYGILRCDGAPIIWPEPTHSKTGADGKPKWHSAAEIIDWSLPCPSVFDSKQKIKKKYGLRAQRPLKPNTLKRVIRGVDKHTIKSGKPFIIPIGYGERQGQTPRVHNIEAPMPTAVGTTKAAVCEPFLVQVNHAGGDRDRDMAEPLPTVTGKHGYGVVSPQIAPFTMTNTSNASGTDPREPLNTARTGGGGGQMLITPSLMAIGQTSGGDRLRGADEPINTQVSKAETCLIAPSLIQYHSEHDGEYQRGQRSDEPIMTIDASPRYGLVSAQLTEYFGNGQPISVDDPLHTVTSKDREALTFAHIQKYYDGGYQGAGSGAEEPLGTVTPRDHNALCLAHAVKFKGTNLGQDLRDPLQTVTATSGGGSFGVVTTTVERYAPGTDMRYWPRVRELLNTYCGYTLADDEVILLHIGGAAYFIADVGLRMLTARELYAGMGFPPDYIIDHDYKGKKYPAKEQVARCGNAVCPPVAEALIRANYVAAPVVYVTMAELLKAVSA